MGQGTELSKNVDSAEDEPVDDPQGSSGARIVPQISQHETCGFSLLYSMSLSH